MFLIGRFVFSSGDAIRHGVGQGKISMHWFEAIALGLLQGLTEFLPVSSSGHLSIFEYFLGLHETPRFFDVMLHVGTLGAVLLFYRRVPAQLLHHDLSQEGKSPLSRMMVIALFVMLATIPAVAASLVFRPTELNPGESLASVDRSWTQVIGDLREYSSQQPGYVLTFMGYHRVCPDRWLPRSWRAGRCLFHEVVARALASVCRKCCPLFFPA